MIVPALMLAAVWLVFFSISKAEDEKQDARQSEPIPIAKIDENILNGMKHMNYNEIKEKLNATGDFCLVVVDKQDSILLERHPNGKTQADLCDGMI